MRTVDFYKFHCNFVCYNFEFLILHCIGCNFNNNEETDVRRLH